jgi:hypothetical protein
VLVAAHAAAALLFAHRVLSDECRLTCLTRGLVRTKDTADLDADDAPTACHRFIPSGPALPVGNSMIVGYKAPREPRLIPGSLLIITLASGRGWLSCSAYRSVCSARSNVDVFDLDLPTSLPDNPFDPDLHFSRPALRDSPASLRERSSSVGFQCA